MQNAYPIVYQLIHIGDQYGATGSLTYSKEQAQEYGKNLPMIEFSEQLQNGETIMVQRYYVASLLDGGFGWHGLQLNNYHALTLHECANILGELLKIPAVRAYYDTRVRQTA